MKIIKRMFRNKDIKYAFIFTIMCLIIFFMTKVPIFLLGPLIFGIIFPMLLFVEYDTLKEEENFKKIKEGNRKYQIFYLSKDKFIKECKSGLVNSVVKINGKVYKIEVQLDGVNSKRYNKFKCYINDIEIIGLDNFINYKFENEISINDLEKIEFLEYNEQDPRKYFEDKII